MLNENNSWCYDEQSSVLYEYLADYFTVIHCIIFAIINVKVELNMKTNSVHFVLYMKSNCFGF